MQLLFNNYNTSVLHGVCYACVCINLNCCWITSQMVQLGQQLLFLLLPTGSDTPVIIVPRSPTRPESPGAPGTSATPLPPVLWWGGASIRSSLSLQRSKLYIIIIAKKHLKCFFFFFNSELNWKINCFFLLSTHRMSLWSRISIFSFSSLEALSSFWSSWSRGSNKPLISLHQFHTVYVLLWLVIM